MASGINLSIVTDVRQAIRGFERTGESIGDVADKLEDVARESRTAGDKLENDMRDVRNDTDRAADDMERSFRKAFDDVKKESKDASRQVSRDAEKGTADAETYTGEFRDEARQNFSEVTSSFDGSMDSIADLAQGTLGGLAGNLAGPIGLVSGGLAAIGGVMYASFKDNAEKSEERISNMFDDMLESGNRFLSEQFVQQGLADIYGQTEDAAISMERLKDIAEQTGVAEEIVALAFAGHSEARVQLLQAVNAKAKEVGDTFQESLGEGSFDVEAQGGLNRIREEVEDLAGEYDSAASRADGYRQSAQLLNTELYALPESKKVRVEVDVDTGTLSRKLNTLTSDIERRRIVLQIDPKLTSNGRSTL